MIIDMLATYDLLAAFYASDTLPSPLRRRYQDHDHGGGVDVGEGGGCRAEPYIYAYFTTKRITILVFHSKHNKETLILLALLPLLLL